jgi:hypothetical protein
VSSLITLNIKSMASPPLFLLVLRWHLARTI